MSPATEAEPFASSWSHMGLGSGIEFEQIQRVTLAQIKKFLPEVTKKLQEKWDKKDADFAANANIPFKTVQIPQVENFFTGIKPSLLEAPIEMWPSITVYCHNAKASPFQPDQYDENLIPLFIDVLCTHGPIQQDVVHKKDGILAEQALDSQLQRLSDAVQICIKKDPTLGATITGPIEKPPTIITSLPWAKTEASSGSNVYIYQGKLHEYTVKKDSF